MTRPSASGLVVEVLRRGRGDVLGHPCISVWEERNSSRDRGAWSPLGQSLFMDDAWGRVLPAGSSLVQKLRTLK